MRRLLMFALLLAWLPFAEARAEPIPDCTASDINLSVYSEGAGGGSWISHYEVTTRVPCELSGAFGAHGFSRRGRVLFDHVRHGHSESVVTPAHPVYFTVTSQDWHPQTEQACPVATRIVFRPPSREGRESLHGQHLTACPSNPAPLMGDLTRKKPPRG